MVWNLVHDADGWEDDCGEGSTAVNAPRAYGGICNDRRTPVRKPITRSLPHSALRTRSVRYFEQNRVRSDERRGTSELVRT